MLSSVPSVPVMMVRSRAPCRVDPSNSSAAWPSGKATRIWASSAGLAFCSGALARVAKTEVAVGPMRLARKSHQWMAKS